MTEITQACKIGEQWNVYSVTYMTFHESYETEQSLPTATYHNTPIKTQSRREDLQTDNIGFSVGYYPKL